MGNVEKWENDVEFATGTLDDVIIHGTGDEAILTLAPENDKNFQFTNPIDFTFDSKSEVTNNVGRPTIWNDQAKFFADFELNQNATWGLGSLTGTLNGGASVDNGKLELLGNLVKYITYNAVNNAQLTQKGCIRFKFTPNFTNLPTSPIIFFKISNGIDLKNTIYVSQRQVGTSANIGIVAYDKDGVEYSLTTFGVKNNYILDQTYEMELNFDFTTGITEFYIDGIKLGSTWTQTLIRDTNVSIITIGSDGTSVLGTNSRSNHYIDKFIIFNEVQHTTNYTPNQAISPTYYNQYSKIRSLELLDFEISLSGFVETATKPTSTGIKYQISIDGGSTWRRWNGSAWVPITDSQTDDFYYENESNDAITINSNILAITSTGGIFCFRVFFKSYSSVRPEISNLLIVTIVEFVEEGTYYSKIITTTNPILIDTITFSLNKPANTTALIYVRNIDGGKWNLVENEQSLHYTTSFYQWKVIFTSNGVNSPSLDFVTILYYDLIVVYDGWSVDLNKISLFSFGSIERFIDIPESIIEDAINMLYTELDAIKPGLSNIINKNDKILNQAITYFACCLMVKAGLATQRSNVIQSESMEGMSVSYARDQQDKLKNRIPYDYCAMAIDLVQRYATINKLITRNIVMSVKNYRDDIWNGIFDKYNPFGR